jgi:predicted acyltransferase
MTTLLREPQITTSPASDQPPPIVTVEKQAVPPPVAEKPARLVSLDAYRGFIMLAMASAGLAIPAVANKHFPNSQVWQFLAFHTEHVAWIGCSFWDLIQPSFMFMVGVALPYSYASRKFKGDSDSWIYVHALWRSLALVLLGVFLSTDSTHTMTNWVFPNVLCQIGLAYPFLFLLVGRRVAVQLGVLALIVVGYTLFFGLWPLPSADFDYKAVLDARDWPWPYHLHGWFAHWDKNANPAAYFDQWFLNLFPRQKTFVYNNGGYATLNFVPSLATMLLGLMAGEWLRRPGSRLRHFNGLVLAGIVCLFLGLLMGDKVCPIVKRIWTPSWALYSSGWTFLMLAGFYGVIDILGWKRWAFALVVVGMNSIAMYCMAQLLKPFIRTNLNTHLGWPFGKDTFLTKSFPDLASFSAVYGPIVQAAAVLLVLWLVCLWMYRRGLFLKI